VALRGLSLSLVLGCASHVPRETIVEPAVAELHLDFIPGLFGGGIPVLTQRDAEHGVSHFILDTGSEGTVISDRYAARMGFPSRLTFPYRVIGAQKESRAADRVVRIEELKFQTAREPGSVAFRGFDAVVVAHMPIFDAGIEGTLGTRLLDDRTFTIDFAANVLRIEEAPLDPSLPHTAPIQVSWGGLVYVPVEIAGESQWVLLDTGDNGWLTVPEGRWGSLPLNDKIQDGRSDGLSLGGLASSRLSILDGSIVIAGQTWRNPLVESGKHFRIGMGPLQGLALSIDKRSRLLRLVRSDRKLADRI